ncbi:hypothetical protein M0R04_07295 [Candidatus Dojkabacteria bacterium]|jgi:hypothetical protein|nr:hypothetical protein [Candidatus Dojkabacteria bacterium]
MDTRIEKYINSIEIDTWQDTNRDGELVNRTRSIYCGDGQGDFEKRSYYTTIECLEDYMIHCDDQKQLAFKDLIKLIERQQ